MSATYATMREAAERCDIPLRTMYRLARDLGVETVMYGRRLVPTSKLEYLRRHRRGRGNPTWVSDSEEAAKAAVLAAKSRAKNRKAKR